MDEAPAVPRVREAAWLVGPLVTLAAVVGLLAAAKFQDRLPVEPPDCGFRKAVGLPCVGCGGTRSARALASGRIAEAARFNPAVVFGVGATLAWSVVGCTRFLRGISLPEVSEQNRRIRRNAILAVFVLLLNWIHLIVFLP
mgnify:CR=1 FL=1